MARYTRRGLCLCASSAPRSISNGKAPHNQVMSAQMGAFWVNACRKHFTAEARRQARSERATAHVTGLSRQGQIIVNGPTRANARPHPVRLPAIVLAILRQGGPMAKRPWNSAQRADIEMVTCVCVSSLEGSCRPCVLATAWCCRPDCRQQGKPCSRRPAKDRSRPMAGTGQVALLAFGFAKQRDCGVNRQLRVTATRLPRQLQVRRPFDVGMLTPSLPMTPLKRLRTTRTVKGDNVDASSRSSDTR